MCISLDMPNKAWTIAPCCDDKNPAKKHRLESNSLTSLLEVILNITLLTARPTKAYSMSAK